MALAQTKALDAAGLTQCSDDPCPMLARLGAAIAEIADSKAEVEQYVYAVSHDLQEPTRTILCFLELLRRDHAAQLGPQGLEYLEFAARSARQLNTLIADLLAYSHTRQSGCAPMASAQDAFDQSLLNLSAALEESGAVVSRDPLPQVPAHYGQLVQVFEHLLSNALKFRAAAPPSIHVLARPADAEWIFSVRDNGVGIAPEYCRRIFDAFYRLHPASQKPGSGLGLAVCKRIIEFHGGRIWVESQPGHGSTFHFTLPASTAPDPA